MKYPIVLASRPAVLVVDDTPDNLILMSSLLKRHYQVKLAKNGKKAMQLAQSDNPPDLILLDIMMPEMDGYEVCRELKSNSKTRDIPVIFLTVKGEVEDERLGLSLGAVDYISKPVSPPIVLARVETHLTLKRVADFLRDKNAYLENEVQRRSQEINAIQDVTIFAMASLAETRDPETGNHIRRTQHYVKALATHLRKDARYSDIITDAYLKLLYKSAPLHDIGKVGIPDRILLKPGRFTADEFEIMKTHTTLGFKAIGHAEKSLGTPVAFLHMAREIALYHHEKWDGSGYPEGLAGEEIPLSARLMAVADVYDALISRRVYKEGMSHEKAILIIIEDRGSHFAPDLLDAFMAIEKEFRSIAQCFADNDEELKKKLEYVDKALGEAP
jgi:putative two-component system response regulator